MRRVSVNLSTNKERRDGIVIKSKDREKGKTG